MKSSWKTGRMCKVGEEGLTVVLRQRDSVCDLDPQPSRCCWTSSCFSPDHDCSAKCRSLLGRWRRLRDWQ